MSEDRIRSVDECKEEAVPVCLHCLEPCSPREYYCGNCGWNDPINPLTPYVAFVNIRFNTGMVAKVWERFARVEGRRWGRLFDLVVVLVFFPLLVLGVPCLIWSQRRKGKYRNAKGIAICLLIVVLVVVLWIAVRQMGMLFRSNGL